VIIRFTSEVLRVAMPAGEILAFKIRTNRSHGKI